MNHGNRYEDTGFARILKYWQMIALIFTIGGWYQSTRSNAEITARIAQKQDIDSERITRVEDAVISLQKIADWTDRHRR
jgi:hypothetical protein